LKGKEYAHLARPLTLAERNVERCDNIISELLDFSRQRKIQKQPLAIGPWLADLIGEFPIPGDVQLQWELDSHTVVPVDSERLRRVMINVITNALQAFDEVPDRAQKLEISSRTVDERYEIIVSDNGPGMSEEVLARIYEPMYSTKTFGVGLGVPIIKNVLEGHGGGVEYHSQVGNGTTVVMWLPLDDAC
jgi:signal transduction histidine kinase